MITIFQQALPSVPDPSLAQRGETDWLAAARETGQPAIDRFAREAIADPSVGALLRGTFAYSPHLTHMLTNELAFVREVIDLGPDGAFTRMISELAATPVEKLPTPETMGLLRRAKRRGAVAISLADLAGAWPLERVTAALSLLADTSLDLATRHILALPAFARLAASGAGLVILGMGKLGARELNYSSDIDLVAFYDAPDLAGADADHLGPGFVRLVRMLVRIMEERTEDGYVFRTDFRLRPDPASTPLAVSVAAAEYYYGSLGQNWERAAMIKARQIAGDPKAGEALFSILRPWIWRRNLDFAAIEDIHSIKRQIDQRKLKPYSSGLLGHDVKLGRGGIREIEFYAQTQQLIFGGRDPSLRVPGTCDALAALAAAKRIDPTAAEELSEDYRFLRKIEHRLQMVNDQQTHILPGSVDGLTRIAGFAGYADPDRFVLDLSATLLRVQNYFGQLFAQSPSLSGPGSLVFTGVEDDPETLATLQKLGFANPRGVAAAIRGWHHGHYRATRSERVREILTRITPDLLAGLARTAEPDTAFARFDAFLAGLPAGVTLLSLFDQNRHLLALVGRIMGMAPILAEQLSRTPALFDELLSPDFFAVLPAPDGFREDLDRALAVADGYESALVRLRRWVAGRKFQAGVHILEGLSDGIQAGRFLADVAEASIAKLLPLVEAEFARTHGRIPGGGLAVLALGRLGGRLMSFSSDLDLITLYDAPEGAMSDGRRSLDAATYFARLTQRLIAAISAPMDEGRLYAVDLRLRPSGEAGPVAVSFGAFLRYQQESAWTWEHMALTRARLIAGSPQLATSVDDALRTVLTLPRDPERLRADVAEMRQRIAAEHPARNRWDFKYVPGGLIDIEFVLQYLLLRHGAQAPRLLTTESSPAINRLAEAGFLDPAAGADLRRALELSWRVQGVVRLTASDLFDSKTAPGAIRKRLADEVWIAADQPPGSAVDFAEAETILDRILAASHDRFLEIVENAPSPGGEQAQDEARMSLSVGSAAPNFTLPTDGGGTVSLSALKGKPVILYFYPKDDTTGCTAEACAFRDSFPNFRGAKAEIIGVSKDSVARHDKFKKKYDLPFTLASDEKGHVCEDYGIWVEKSMYGRKYMGIERTTFLIDKAGKIRRIWNKVKVAGHAAEVLKALAEL
jgi:glutamate-ammonia-ligase adenylyltransferase